MYNVIVVHEIVWQGSLDTRMALTRDSSRTSHTPLAAMEAAVLAVLLLLSIGGAGERRSRAAAASVQAAPSS